MKKVLSKALVMSGLIAASGTASAFFSYEEVIPHSYLEVEHCPGSVMHIGDVRKKDLYKVTKAGKNIVLKEAVKQIIPKSWKVEGDDIKTLTSWKKNMQWTHSIWHVAKKSNSCVTLDWTKKIAYVNTLDFVERAKEKRVLAAEKAKMKSASKIAHIKKMRKINERRVAVKLKKESANEHYNKVFLKAKKVKILMTLSEKKRSEDLAHKVKVTDAIIKEETAKKLVRERQEFERKPTLVRHKHVSGDKSGHTHNNDYKDDLKKGYTKKDISTKK